MCICAMALRLRNKSPSVGKCLGRKLLLSWLASPVWGQGVDRCCAALAVLVAWVAGLPLGKLVLSQFLQFWGPQDTQGGHLDVVARILPLPISWLLSQSIAGMY